MHLISAHHQFKLNSLNVYSDFIFDAISFELVGHEVFGKFHQYSHVSTVNSCQALVANIAQVSVVPKYLSAVE